MAQLLVAAKSYIQPYDPTKELHHPYFRGNLPSAHHYKDFLAKVDRLRAEHGWPEPTFFFVEESLLEQKPWIENVISWTPEAVQ